MNYLLKFNYDETLLGGEPTAAMLLVYADTEEAAIDKVKATERYATASDFQSLTLT